MTPPLFVWKSGVLDVFDSADELTERYAADELAGGDVALYDGEGRALRASAEPNGTTRIVGDTGQPPQPERLAALLRGYLERGRVPADSLAALTLSELIERVYPSPVPPQRVCHTKGKRKRKPQRPSDEQPADQQTVGRLVDAFGIALLVGMIGACVGFGLSIAYYRNLPPSPSSYYGGIGEAIQGVFEATIAYLWVLSQHGLLGRIHAEKIGCAFITLVAVLATVGVGVWCIGFWFIAVTGA
jgi:hypothetical protein